ncbi:MAG: EAL domain-containing protein [Novosphingobium sp.]|uniref:putative bifunctional diguanylate cyclase/phosphodiesterase n=1 Tax=Novosphingobium sp. TaxID=1874826 RepID=UPI0032BACFFC
MNIVETARARLGNPGRDAIVLGVTFAAIGLFIQTGGTALSRAIASLSGHSVAPDLLLSTALMLNVALIIFGWRRYRDLQEEISERRKAEAQARGLAELDPLTGCLNRRSIGPASATLLDESGMRGESVAVIMLDLDRFKQVNDANGHAAGDALLKAAADRIAALLPANSLLARLGGDEFAVVTPFTTSQPAQIERLVAHLISAVARPVRFENIELETTISAGISCSEQGVSSDPQALLHQADIAMYHAKRSGRNNLAWFEPSMESELKYRSAIEAGIRSGISAGEFVPHYEQQIDLETGEITGFEMLARWTSPTLGKISPEMFIPIAEDIGLIGKLSESLIRQALNDARKWKPHLTLSVNISPVQLRDIWFAQKLLKLLVEANFPPSRFDVEVTESCLHENIALVRSILTSLKNQGVKVSLDDFGTGYSSLSQLRSLPFDRIKIDRSFVIGLLEDQGSATIMQSIIGLGNGLGLPITAEGIETEEVLTELRRYGNFKGQGYHFGQPESAARTEELLAQLGLLLDQPESMPLPSDPIRRTGTA